MAALLYSLAAGSSTGFGIWEEGAKTIPDSSIYENVGPHLEKNQDRPSERKYELAEVSLGWTDWAQAVADKKEGLPIDYIDPTEGNFTLTESVAVLDKGDQSGKPWRWPSVS